MNLNEIFSHNLRRLCLARSTIADVCRETGINRQQFNKYLSARSMPSASTLRKICSILRVNESELMCDSTVEIGKHVSAAHSAKNLVRDYSKLVRSLAPQAKQFPNLTSVEFQPGLYNCYFPFDEYEGFAVRTIIKVWRVEKELCFIRLTKIKSDEAKLGTIMRARHCGIITASTNEITFLARNTLPPFQVSIISVERQKLFDTFLLGFSITRSSNKQIATRVVIEKLHDSITQRQAISSLGIVAVNHRTIPPQVRAALSVQSQHKAISMRHPNKDELISNLLAYTN